MRETNEASMVAAHKAGAAFGDGINQILKLEVLQSLARSCGWHGDDNDSWVAGFYGARKRSQEGG